MCACVGLCVYLTLLWTMRCNTQTNKVVLIKIRIYCVVLRSAFAFCWHVYQCICKNFRAVAVDFLLTQHFHIIEKTEEKKKKNTHTTSKWALYTLMVCAALVYVWRWRWCHGQVRRYSCVVLVVCRQSDCSKLWLLRQLRISSTLVSFIFVLKVKG